MKKRIAFLLAVLSSGAAVCAPQARSAPTPAPHVMANFPDNVPYGTDPAQKMDIYLPTGFAGPRPGVEMIHGGGWQAGDKGFYASMGRAVSARGFVAFSVNYRLTPAAHYPAQADYVQQAARWMRAHAEEY